MNDPTQSEDVVINRPDGSEAARWHKLTPAEFIEAAKALKRIRKRQCFENMQAQNITGGPLIRALNECDARRVSYVEVVKLVDDFEGQAELLMIAIRRAQPDAKIEAINDLGLRPWQWQEHAAKLMNVPLKLVEEDGKDPLAGEKNAGTETGTGKPT